MTTRRLLAAALGGILAAAAGVAVASNGTSSDQSDYFAPGKHQFYVWCAGGTDYTAAAVGLNAEDAQMRLYNAVKAKGQETCWPVWQGREAG